LLEIDNVSKNYGGNKALNRVSCKVLEGEIVSLIGPNGSGKTTLFNCITNFDKTSEGKINFCDIDITGLDPLQIARKALIRTFQICRVFYEMSVMDNLMVAAQQNSLQWPFFKDIFVSLLRTRRIREIEYESVQKAREILSRLNMLALENNLASELSYGQQKLLMLGMSLMAKPKMLLLDEPVAGVSPILVREIVSILRYINGDKGVTIFMIEHNMDVALELANKVIVFQKGTKLAEGTPDEIKNNDEVLKAYFPS